MRRFQEGKASWERERRKFFEDRKEQTEEVERKREQGEGTRNGRKEIGEEQKEKDGKEYENQNTIDGMG